MGRPELDSRITKPMHPQGWNFESSVGCSHDTSSDKKNAAFTKPGAMGNPKEMDPSMPKPSSANPGVDKSFLAKGNPQMDVTGHGRLTSSNKG